MIVATWVATNLDLPRATCRPFPNATAPKASSSQHADEIPAPSRRGLLAAFALGPLLTHVIPQTAQASSVAALASITPQLAPDQTQYDAADPKLRDAGRLVQEALNASDVRQEEALWTEIIRRYEHTDANWTADVAGRAYGNRGNARARIGQLDDALRDYDRAIELCPWSPDPVLNRGVVLEGLGRFPEAIVDYRSVLEVAPDDPAAWNNLGNATAGLGDWASAAEYYGRAASLSPQFAFAAGNLSLANYQLGNNDVAAMRDMRALLRKYPEFADVRAALAAALWESGLLNQAEDEWRRVEDPRYRDLEWLKRTRRWPPRLQKGLTAFLNVQSVDAEASAG